MGESRWTNGCVSFYIPSDLDCDNMLKYINDAVFAAQRRDIPKIEDVIFNGPATVVKWADGDKTVVRCQDGDNYSKETGLAMAIAKKSLGNKGNFNEVFKKWIPGYGEGRHHGSN